MKIFVPSDFMYYGTARQRNKKGAGMSIELHNDERHYPCADCFPSAYIIGRTTVFSQDVASPRIGRARVSLEYAIFLADRTFKSFRRNHF